MKASERPALLRSPAAFAAGLILVLTACAREIAPSTGAAVSIQERSAASWSEARLDRFRT